MARKDPRAAIERHTGILHVHVVDAIREEAYELRRIDTLPQQVAGIEIEAELLAGVERIDRALGGVDIEGDFGRVHLQRELYAALLEYVENRVPALGQQREASVDHRARHRRKIVHQMPDARPGKAVDDAHAELLSGPGGVFHLFGGALVDSVGLAVAPDVLGENGFVPGVDRVEHRLPDEVVRDGEELQVVLLKELALASA